MAFKICVVNQKGGVGKSSVALNLAETLQHEPLNYKVLFIDMDAQCNSTSYYNAEVDGVSTLVDVLMGECEASEAVQHTEKGDIIAGDPSLADVADVLNTKMNRYDLLKEKISEIEGEYDFVICDNGPNLGLYMINAMTYCTGCIVPIKAEKFALDGLGKLMKTISDVKKYQNPDFKIYGVLMNVYDSRTSLDKQILSQLPEYGDKAGFPVFNNPIRTCQVIKEAQVYGKSIYDLDPTCNAVEDYIQFTKDLLSRL